MSAFFNPGSIKIPGVTVDWSGFFSLFVGRARYFATVACGILPIVDLRGIILSVGYNIEKSSHKARTNANGPVTPAASSAFPTSVTTAYDEHVLNQQKCREYYAGYDQFTSVNAQSQVNPDSEELTSPRDAESRPPRYSEGFLTSIYQALFCNCA